MGELIEGSNVQLTHKETGKVIVAEIKKVYGRLKAVDRSEGLKFIPEEVLNEYYDVQRM